MLWSSLQLTCSLHVWRSSQRTENACPVSWISCWTLIYAQFFIYADSGDWFWSVFVLLGTQSMLACNRQVTANPPKPYFTLKFTATPLHWQLHYMWASVSALIFCPSSAHMHPGAEEVCKRKDRTWYARRNLQLPVTKHGSTLWTPQIATLSKQC